MSEKALGKDSRPMLNSIAAYGSQLLRFGSTAAPSRRPRFKVSRTASEAYCDLSLELFIVGKPNNLLSDTTVDISPTINTEKDLCSSENLEKNLRNRCRSHFLYRY